MSQPFATLLLAAVLLSGHPNGGSAEERDSDGDLSKALTAYFKEPDHSIRANLVVEVTEAAEGSIERVVRGLEELQIWGAAETGPIVLEVGSEGEQVVRLHVTPPSSLVMFAPRRWLLLPVANPFAHSRLSRTSL